MYNSILPKSMQDETNLALEKCINKAFDISLAPFMVSLPDLISKNVLFMRAEQLSLTDGDGWQNCKTEQEKRTLLKKSLMIHKFKATKKCIYDFLNKSNLEVNISDWYEYNGLNNHYCLEFDSGALEEIENLLKQIEQNKRLSAKLDKLIYNLSQTIENNFTIVPMLGEVITIDFD